MPLLDASNMTQDSRRRSRLPSQGLKRPVHGTWVRSPTINCAPPTPLAGGREVSEVATSSLVSFSLV